MPRRAVPRPDQPRPDQPRPEVIVDFACREGLLFVMLKNIGARSAYRVATRFDKPFSGLGGAKPMADLRLFRRLDFMAPGKEFCQLVDPLALYLKRREPVRLTAIIAYRDREGCPFEDVITHDLRIYQDLGEIRLARPSEAR
ncbi:MAG TPA: hypothetical protein VGA23_06115 [Methylomirabilota bacterium]|jgi:hypothetical protein|nr:hypothetical protein [Candidatus Eisenbacteria bacterium]